MIKVGLNIIWFTITGIVIVGITEEMIFKTSSQFPIPTPKANHEYMNFTTADYSWGTKNIKQ